MDWKHLLAYSTGTVDQELLLRHEYLVTENRLLRNQLKGRVRLRDGERKTLAEIGQKLGHGLCPFGADHRQCLPQDLPALASAVARTTRDLLQKGAGYELQLSQNR